MALGSEGMTATLIHVLSLVRLIPHDRPLTSRPCYCIRVEARDGVEERDVAVMVWKVRRRYNDFVRLHRQLQSQVNSAVLARSVLIMVRILI
jgi:hypothetical protein